jgi:hypothetical protein
MVVPGMIRTQIQLTDEQAGLIKEAAAEYGVSMAEMIRRSVDQYLKSSGPMDRRDRRERARSAAGRLRSSKGDLSTRHDEHLAEAYGK